MTEALPIIDVGAFLEQRASAAAAAREIEKARFSKMWSIMSCK